MRFLFTFMGGNGHFAPLAPIARAAQQAGHTVAFGCGPHMAPLVTRAGFDVFPLGAPGSAAAPERLPLRPVDLAREEEEFRERFADGATRRRLPLTLDLCRTWRPDVLVCDEADFGGILAAELYGIPSAVVVVLAAGTFARPGLVGPTLNAIRAEYGLAPDPELGMLNRYLVLSPVPAAYRDPRFPFPKTTHFVRPYTVRAPAQPPFALARPAAPTLYFTLGTIFNTESGDLFARVIAGLRELPVNLVVTLGNEIDPAELGPQPAHVIVRQFIPQHELLPHCDAIVSHAGSGSVLGALAHGLPMLLLPMGADQPMNADRCAQLGVALTLDPLAATPEQVRDAARAILNEARFRSAAERLQAEIAAMPPPESTVALLEELVERNALTDPDPDQ